MQMAVCMLIKKMMMLALMAIMMVMMTLTLAMPHQF